MKQWGDQSQIVLECPGWSSVALWVEAALKSCPEAVFPWQELYFTYFYLGFFRRWWRLKGVWLSSHFSLCGDGHLQTSEVFLTGVSRLAEREKPLVGTPFLPISPQHCNTKLDVSIRSQPASFRLFITWLPWPILFILQRPGFGFVATSYPSIVPMTVFTFMVSKTVVEEFLYRSNHFFLNPLNLFFKPEICINIVQHWPWVAFW